MGYNRQKRTVLIERGQCRRKHWLVHFGASISNFWVECFHVPGNALTSATETVFKDLGTPSKTVMSRIWMLCVIVHNTQPVLALESLLTNINTVNNQILESFLVIKDIVLPATEFLTVMTDSTNPILIIGAGISGLTLAQACRKENIPFRIFERDSSATHRSAGWGLTLNWALSTFRSLLPVDILERLPETLVNKEAVDAGEKGSFAFYDLSTGVAKYYTPASERLRVSRERLRKLMLSGLDVEWSKTLVDITKESSGITAKFTDGTSISGSLLIGCDGANSQARRLCHPEDHKNDQLPIRFIGTGVHYTSEQVSEIRKLDPYFLQGSDPRLDAYLWFSFLNTPSDPNSGEGKDDRYYCQIMISWPARSGFLGREEPTEMPETKEEQLNWMKLLAQNWAEPFRSVVQNIPPDCEILPIHLADWIPRRTTAFDGRVVLIGDSAHAMVMYRGEGANHSIIDISVILQHIRHLVKPEEGSGVEASDEVFQDALEKYQIEMIERSELGVLASRQACLDAHDATRLNDSSPLVRRRLMRVDLEQMK